MYMSEIQLNPQNNTPIMWTAGKQVLVLLLLISVIQSATGKPTYNVFDFHAVGDGKMDDAKAFLAAWKEACADSRQPVLRIPAGSTFLLSQITFQGQCKSAIRVQLDGNIIAPNNIWTSGAANLITFYSIDNLTLEGTGQINGRGKIWWNCFNQKKCNSRPYLLAFAECNNVWVKGIELKNSADKHMTLYACSEVHVQWVTITSPGDSPNTDGIVIAESQHVEIANCTIGCGDDCIAILSGCSDIRIIQNTCGPSHGISIGSLGGSGSAAKVEQITVAYCKIFQSLTGVRIKSWQGGKGYAKGFLFEHINMSSVVSPIIIDQFYCPQGNCAAKDGGVAISDVRFISIHGTSSGQEAIKLLCNKQVPCRGIYLEDIKLSWEGKTAPANATCFNAYGNTLPPVVPPVTLL